MKNIFKKSNDYDETTGKPFTLFKILVLMLIMFMVLSFIIGASYIQNGELVETTVTKLGIMEMFLGSFYSLQYFVLQIILILCVGGLYGVLSKTSGYKKIVDKLSGLVKKWKFASILLISLFFALITSVIYNDVVILFLFVPLAVSVLNKANVDKVVTFCTTFGSIMVGIIGATYAGFGLDLTYIDMGAEYGSNVTTSWLILAIAYVLLNMFSIMRMKNTERKPVLMEDRFEVEEESTKSSAVPIMIVVLGILSTFVAYGLSLVTEMEDILLLVLSAVLLYALFFIPYFILSKKKPGKNRCWPLIVALASLGLIVLVGYTNWGDMTESTIFSDFNTWLKTDVSVKTEEVSSIGVTTEVDTPVVRDLVGDVSPFGSWDKHMACIYIIIFALVIGLAYGLTLDGTIGSFANGALKVLGPACLYALAHILSIFTSWLPIINNIAFNLLEGVTVFNFSSIIVLLLVGFLCAVFIADPGLMGYLLGAFLAYKFPSNLASVALVVNSGFSLAQFLVPTGMLLFLGLSYCKISYTTYLKHIWKFVLGMLIALIIVFTFVG